MVRGREKGADLVVMGKFADCARVYKRKNSKKTLEISDNNNNEYEVITKKNCP